jgi:chaperonin cofactor prefoldin
MHSLHVTRSPVADEFRDWVETNVFALAYGTATQKEDMLVTLCRVDKTFMQVLMKVSPNPLACIYLVDTAMRDGDSKVYKFGRSGNMKERLYDHTAAFGDGTVLDTAIFIPSDKLVEAEASLRKSIMKESKFTLNKAKELISLDNAGRKTLRTIMQTITDKYYGSMTIQASKHERELDDMKNMYELRIKDLECITKVVRAELNAENAKLTAAVALLHEKLANAHEKLANAHENTELRLELAASKISALQVEIASLKSRIKTQQPV